MTVRKLNDQIALGEQLEMPYLGPYRFAPHFENPGLTLGEVVGDVACK